MWAVAGRNAPMGAKPRRRWRFPAEARGKRAAGRAANLAAMLCSIAGMVAPQVRIASTLRISVAMSGEREPRDSASAISRAAAAR